MYYISNFQSLFNSQNSVRKNGYNSKFSNLNLAQHNIEATLNTVESPLRLILSRGRFSVSNFPPKNHSKTLLPIKFKSTFFFSQISTHV